MLYIKSQQDKNGVLSKTNWYVQKGGRGEGERTERGGRGRREEWRREREMRGGGIAELKRTVSITPKTTTARTTPVAFLQCEMVPGYH